MRLVWIILAALAFGGLTWFGLNYGPMSGRAMPGWSGVTAPQTREPVIAPPGAISATPRYAAPMLVIERSALESRDTGADLSKTAAFALPGVSLGASVGASELRKRKVRPGDSEGEVKRRTLRIWSIPETVSGNTFSLNAILRPPLGDGRVTSIDASAISHDRRMTAAAATRWDGEYPVYIFDRTNGRILATLTGFPAQVNSIAFSRDGRYLAIGMARIDKGSNPSAKGGVRFFRTSDWRWIGQDANYSEKVSAIAFDSGGRVATSSADGYVRVYDPGFGTVKKAKTLQGSMPFGVAFSPDASQIAVGYFDNAVVSILDTQSLAETRVLRPPRETSPADWLTTVSWSNEGRSVYAAGGYTDERKEFPILRWSMGETNAPAETLSALRFKYPVVALTPFRVDGVAAFTQVVDTEDPDESQGLEFGALDKEGKVAARTSGEVSGLASGTMAGDIDAFRVNRAGTIVEVPGAKDNLIRIDMIRRITSPASSSTLDFAAPRRSHPDAELIDWRGASVPRLRSDALRSTPVTGGVQELKLDTGERALAYAFSPVDPFLYLATNHAIRTYSFRGALMQTVPAPSAVQRVTVTPDGTLIVAAMKDGTIRWYNAARGEELLAVYVAGDPQKWIAWTPSGYYDAGPGADSLIGWQVPRSGDAEPMYFPAGTFANTFYRPGLAVQVLRDRVAPPAPPADVLLAALPPVVTILGVCENASQCDQTREVVIRFKVESPANRPVTQLLAVIDGVKMPVDLSDGPLAIDREMTLTFPLPDGEDEMRNVSLTAGYEGDALGAASTRGFIVSASSLLPAVDKRERLLALVVGVSDYQDANINDLRFAKDDATAIGLRLKNQMSKFYKETDVRVLTEDAAKTQAILTAMQELEAKATKDDVVLVFFAGHGVPDPKRPDAADGKNYYFVSHDADAGNLSATAVPHSKILRLLTNSTGRRMLFLDTCYSGLLADPDLLGRDNAIPDINGLANEFEKKGIFVAAASSGTALALEDDSWEHGAMTAALLKVFDGRADVTADGRTGITTDRLRSYLYDEIPRLTNGCQEPFILDLNAARFTFAKVDPNGVVPLPLDPTPWRKSCPLPPN